MDPGIKSSLLWGLVGTLSFLVLVQSYHFITDEFVSIGVIAGLSVGVGIVTALVTHAIRPRLRRRYYSEASE